MSPRWLHWRIQSSLSLLDFSGTFDTDFGAGSADTSPTITAPATWATDYPSFNVFGVRSGATEGVQWTFTNSTDCLQFVSDFPDNGSVNFALYLSYFGKTYTTISGWSWILTNSDTRAKIVFDLTNWDSTDALATYLTGTDYTITAS